MVSARTVSARTVSANLTGAPRAVRRVFNRYATFLAVVALSAFSPALPHSTTPDYTWWAVSFAFLIAMVIAGWIGAYRPATHWINTVGPLLLLPAMHALRCADGNSTSGFTPLIFLPVVWFALYGRLRDVLIAVVGGALALVLPMVVVGPPQFPTTNWRGTALLILVTAALGPLIHRLVETTARANRALRRSEVEFRAAFEDAPVGMAITGLRGDDAYRFIRVNHALCEIFGRTAAELTSVALSELTHPDDVAATETAFERVGEPGAPQRVEKRYVHKSGRTIWAAVSFSVVNDLDGQPSHLISQIENVGARRESDQALLDAFESDRAATERLNRLERVRSEMASTVSHELRTPLTSAAGYVELLVEGDAGPLTSEQRTMLDTVARSLARLDGIVDDVLGIADADKPRPVKDAKADLGSVVKSAVSVVSLQAATRGQDLIVHNDLDDARVTGDAGRLERALVNLLTNALKFTPDDGSITVTADCDRTHARVAIADTGIGISTEDQTRIFERFFRAERGSEMQVSGTGLGLAIVQTITTQYGGTITVDSELGKGSTFTVTLPLLAERATD